MTPSSPTPADPVRLAVGPLRLQLAPAGDAPLVAVPAHYQPFLTAAPADLTVALAPGRPRLAGWEKTFDSPPIWSLYRRGRQRLFSLLEAVAGRSHTLRLAAEEPAAEMCFSPGWRGSLDPFWGPALELLAIDRLAAHRGCLMHGCGIREQGRWLLFAGRSGAGKSTLMRLWAAGGRAEVMSEDRSIVTEEGGRVALHGTPWHAKQCPGRSLSADLAGIFFLAHGAANRLRPLGAAEALRRLMTCAFPPLWDAAGTGAALDLLGRLAGRVPCFELAFAPDARAVTLVRRWLGQGG